MFNHYLHQIADNDAGGPDVGVDLPWLGQVGDAGVRAHEDVDGVQRPLKEPLLCLRQVDAAQRRLGQVVVGDEGEAEEADGVDRVDGLQHAGHPLEALDQIRQSYVKKLHFIK